jgi:hypothetical protein
MRRRKNFHSPSSACSSAGQLKFSTTPPFGLPPLRGEAVDSSLASGFIHNTSARRFCPDWFRTRLLGTEACSHGQARQEIQLQPVLVACGVASCFSAIFTFFRCGEFPILVSSERDERGVPLNISSRLTDLFMHNCCEYHAENAEILICAGLYPDAVRGCRFQLSQRFSTRQRNSPISCQILVHAIFLAQVCSGLHHGSARL